MARLLAPRRALSLVETILSLFILSAVMLLLFNLFPSALAGARRTEQTLQADELAGSILAAARAGPYSELTIDLPLTQPSPVVSNGITYTPNLSVFRVGDRAPNLVKGVRVTVTWKDRGITHKKVHEVIVSGVGH